MRDIRPTQGEPDIPFLTEKRIERIAGGETDDLTPADCYIQRVRAGQRAFDERQVR